MFETHLLDALQLLGTPGNSAAVAKRDRILACKGPTS